MRPNSAAVFFMTFFLQGQGGWPPRPPGSATASRLHVIIHVLDSKYKLLEIANKDPDGIPAALTISSIFSLPPESTESWMKSNLHLVIRSVQKKVWVVLPFLHLFFGGRNKELGRAG